MSHDNTALLRQMVTGPTSGTQEGINASLALLADDVRFWQQGLGFIGKADKQRMWQEMAGQGGVVPVIRSLLSEGDRAALEMVIPTPRGGILVVVFCTFRDGKVIEGREYFLQVPTDEIFAAE